MTGLPAPWADGPPGGVFYLHGEDEFRKEEVAKRLAEAHLDSSTRDFNLDRLRGSEVDVETLASILATPPMMAEWRVVFLRETEGLASSARARELLVETAESPPPGLALILLCSPPARSSARFYKDLRKVCRAHEFSALSPDDLPGWLMERARTALGRELEPEAARALVAASGGELGVLVREVEKLADVAGDDERISLQHVEAAGTRIPSQDRWKWFDLVGERRWREARAGLPVLLSQQGESGVGVTIGLATHLLRIGLLLEGGRAALEQALPRHQRWVARRLGGQARGWTADEVDSALEGLLRVDRLLKSGRLGGEHLLEEWLLGLEVRGRAAA